jgi:ferrous iron transport protein B
MARVAFIMDRIMHKIGLHGRSFIPLLMGFGCNVPAIMATRTIESRTDRILTILINPFMSCSARLPVYILIIGATFPDYPGTVLFGIYGFGILMAALMAVLFKKTIFRNQEAPFVMELPPYRLPTLKAIVRNMWFKGSQYLQKMGGVILIAVIIIWAAGYFPLHKERMAAFDQQIALAEQQHEDQISDLHLADDAGRVLQLQHDAQLQITRLQQQKASFRLENSYIGKLGHWFQPAIAPLGFDWKMGVALITGAAAKEIVVSTMGVLYQDSEEGTDSSTLSQKIRHQRYTVGPLEGQPVFSPAVALAFLIFVLIYFPCIAVVSAVKKETGGWKWALFLVGYTTVLAYALSFLTYRIGLLLF